MRQKKKKNARNPCERVGCKSQGACFYQQAEVSIDKLVEVGEALLGIHHSSPEGNLTQPHYAYFLSCFKSLVTPMMNRFGDNLTQHDPKFFALYRAVMAYYENPSPAPMSMSMQETDLVIRGHIRLIRYFRRVVNTERILCALEQYFLKPIVGRRLRANIYLVERDYEFGHTDLKKHLHIPIAQWRDVDYNAIASQFAESTISLGTFDGKTHISGLPKLPYLEHESGPADSLPLNRPKLDFAFEPLKITDAISIAIPVTPAILRPRDVVLDLIEMPPVRLGGCEMKVDRPTISFSLPGDDYFLGSIIPDVPEVKRSDPTQWDETTPLGAPERKRYGVSPRMLSTRSWVQLIYPSGSKVMARVQYSAGGSKVVLEPAESRAFFIIDAGLMPESPDSPVILSALNFERRVHSKSNNKLLAYILAGA